jgi:hypothetical protein
MHVLTFVETVLLSAFRCCVQIELQLWTRKYGWDDCALIPVFPPSSHWTTAVQYQQHNNTDTSRCGARAGYMYHISLARTLAAILAASSVVTTTGRIHALRLHKLQQHCYYCYYTLS